MAIGSCSTLVVCGHQECVAGQVRLAEKSTGKVCGMAGFTQVGHGCWELVAVSAGPPGHTVVYVAPGMLHSLRSGGQGVFYVGLPLLLSLSQQRHLVSPVGLDLLLGSLCCGFPLPSP